MRNKIYGYVFEDQIHEIMAHGHFQSPVVLNGSISLMQTCRQIYQETKLHPYTHSMFSFACEKGLNRWMRRRTGTQRQVLGRMRLKHILYKPPDPRLWVLKIDKNRFARLPALRCLILYGTRRMLEMRPAGDEGNKLRLEAVAQEFEELFPDVPVESEYSQ
jgi:hypothetical protein